MDDSIRDFLLYNRDMRVFHENGLAVWFRVKESGRISMFIDIEEETTRDQIAEAWPLIKQWRERLSEYQPSHGNYFFRYFHALKQGGYSYRDIADAINHSIEAYIRQGYEDLKARDPRKPSPTSIVCAAGLMTLMGIDDDTKREWIVSALENIEAGQQAFPLESPIDASRVRERLRNPPRTIVASEVSILFLEWQMEAIENEDSTS